ncbi:MAG: hypothetical protein WB697_02175, partial [Stellaceae bacterium]
MFAGMSGGAVAAIRRRPGGALSASGSGVPLSPRALSIGLSAVIVAASEHEPRVLTIRYSAQGRETKRDSVEALPAGPLEAEHRTLELGLRGWV